MTTYTAMPGVILLADVRAIREGAAVMGMTNSLVMPAADCLFGGAGA